MQWLCIFGVVIIIIVDAITLVQMYHEEKC